MKDEKSLFLYILLVLIFSFIFSSVGFIFYLYFNFFYNVPSKKFLREILPNFLMWELVVFLSFSLLLYLLYLRYSRYRRRVKSITGVIFQALEHHLGNFLSTQKINARLISGDPFVKERILGSVESLESDFKLVLNILKQVSLEEGSLSLHEKKIFFQILENYRRLFPERKVSVSIGKIRSFASATIFKILLDLLLSNAFKYSANTINIRWGAFRGFTYLAIRNDLGDAPPGSGLGHQLILRLAEEENLAFLPRQVGRYYVSLLVEKRASRFFHDFFT